MIDRVVTDLIDTTKSRLDELAPASIDDIRTHDSALVSFSTVIHEEHVGLKRFLMNNLYKHDKVRAMTDKAQKMVEVLFQQYMDNPEKMPKEFNGIAGRGNEAERARVVADYIAGMTDRYAIAEYERLG